MPRQGFQPRFSITNAITNALTRIERARGFLEAATLSEQWMRAMGEKALILEAHHTTHIEGTQLTLEQAQRLMRGEAVPEADPDDVRELLNYRQAFELVSDYLESGLPITEGLIREIHQRLVAGVRGDRAMPGCRRPAGRPQDVVVVSRERDLTHEVERAAVDRAGGHEIRPPEFIEVVGREPGSGGLSLERLDNVHHADDPAPPDQPAHKGRQVLAHQPLEGPAGGDGGQRPIRRHRLGRLPRGAGRALWRG